MKPKNKRKLSLYNQLKKKVCCMACYGPDMLPGDDLSICEKDHPDALFIKLVDISNKEL